jgi:phosphohistidine phosphatase
MKTLIIVRHGAFSHSDSQIADVDHPLNRHGHYQVDRMAARLSELQLKPDLLVSSSARRAVETAEAYAKKFEIPLDAIQIEEEIFEAERADILRVVQALDDAVNTVVLFGHHPGVTKLLHHLTDGGVEKMPLGSFAVVEFSVESWRTVSFKKGRLVEYVEPKEKEKHYGLWWRFTFWRRQRMQKVELFFVFIIGLLVILGVIALIVSSSTDSAGMPQQGSMGRNYGTE